MSNVQRGRVTRTRPEVPSSEQQPTFGMNPKEVETMQANPWGLALGLSLSVTLSAQAEITRGVMSVTGAEMD
jgi:hypothetical protein